MKVPVKGPALQAAGEEAFLAGYRACNRVLLQRPGGRALPRPAARFKRRYDTAILWAHFCKGWAQRVVDKREADCDW